MPGLWSGTSHGPQNPTQHAILTKLLRDGDNLLMVVTLAVGYGEDYFPKIGRDRFVGRLLRVIRPPQGRTGIPTVKAYGNDLPLY